LKSKLQSSEPSIPKILQSQNRPVAKYQLSINALAVVHGRLQKLNVRKAVDAIC
jgi:hypothetical protein